MPPRNPSNLGMHRQEQSGEQSTPLNSSPPAGPLTVTADRDLLEISELQLSQRFSTHQHHVRSTSESAATCRKHQQTRETLPRSQSLPPPEISAARSGDIRAEHGQCPSCGQQLFIVSERTHRGLFKGLLPKNRKDKQATKKIVRKPLSVEGHVERGQCLDCRGLPPARGPQHLGGSTTANQNNLDLLPTPGVAPVASLPTGRTLEDEDWLPQSLTAYAMPILHATESSSLGINQNCSNTAIYQGQFNIYGERDGQGTMTWSNGDVYEGEFFNGTRHGQGTLTFANGSEYVGCWECNYMHGDGTRRFPNGDMYVGQYYDGQRQGQGRFYFANGDMYIGVWKDDYMHGAGRYYYQGGQRFEGGFVQGKRQGRGKMQRLDGSLDVYWYNADQRQGAGVRWSPERTKAWKLEHGKVQKKLSVAEAVSLVYDRASQSQGQEGCVTDNTFT
jgi:hypothetical protein